MVKTSREYLEWKVEYDTRAVKDLKSIPPKDAHRVIKKIDEFLRINPYAGEKLEGRLRDCYRYRIGDYRVIYKIENDRIIILILRIGSRKDIYKLPL